MPNRAKKIAKKSNGVRKTPASPKTPAKPEDPVAAFLARLGSAKKGEAALNPAQRRELARRAARTSSAPAAKAPERDSKKR
jgi:hypothetical protein